MPENDSPSTKRSVELADIRPANGEYFSLTSNETKGYCFFHFSPCTCFVCGVITRNPQYIDAITQCLASGRRIVAMFKSKACIVEQDLFGNLHIVVSACPVHYHNANILLGLVADGVITPDRISHAVSATVSRQGFHKLVAERAHVLWSDKEIDRRRRNWEEAWQLCIKELGHIPSLAQRKERAERLSREKVGAQALEDWLEAEKVIAQLYRTDPS